MTRAFPVQRPVDVRRCSDLISEHPQSTGDPEEQDYGSSTPCSQGTVWSNERRVCVCVCVCVCGERDVVLCTCVCERGERERERGESMCMVFDERERERESGGGGV